ncbi:MAG: FG-GAP-like repeat-containing protein [Opitutaceae bacterium]
MTDLFRNRVWLACLLSIAGPARMSAAFTDVTLSSRINHLHATPAAPQTAVFSAPAAAVDVDGDGWTDLVAGRADGPCVLYLNHRDGTFREEAAARGLGGISGIGSIVAGDFSNSGRQDLFLVPLAGYRCHLLINDGTGHFTDQAVARGADLTTQIEPHAGFGVSLVDFDRDGYLDLHLTEWGVPKTNEDALHSVLLRNRGAAAPGFFENVTVAAGLKQPRIGPVHYGFSSAWVDFDEDGWPDLALVGDFNTSQLFWNNGNGTFAEQGRASGVGLDENGMGVAVADYDGDGRFDLFVTSIFDRVSYDFSGLKTGNKLYRNLGGRRFGETSAVAGVDRTGWGWGAAFLDADNDGDPDLLVTNGMTADYVPDPNLPHSTDPLTDPTTLYVNDGTGHFVDGTAVFGLRDTGQGRGVVVADFDNDGDEDVLITQAYGRPVLYRSDAAANGSRWIRLRLQGTLSNRDAIGAVVRVTHGGRTRVHLHNPTSTFLGQREPVLHLGLGQVGSSVDSLEIRWPSGRVQTLFALATNQVHTVVEPGGVQTAPVLVRPPVGGAVTRDTRLSLTVEAAGDPAPVYVWRKDGVVIAGATGATYEVARAHPFDAGSYTVEAINPRGSVVSAPVAVTVVADLSQHSIARWWNEALLDAIRKDLPAPTIHARNLFHLSAALWDAYWPYQAEGWSRAVPLYVREAPALPAAVEAREAAQRQAMCHAAYRVLTERCKASPGRERSFAGFRWLMVQSGYDPEFTGTTGDSPAAVGNRIGFGLLALARNDGSNEANAYADSSGYVARNPPLAADLPGITLPEPNFWQPLSFNNAVTQNGIPLGSIVQTFVGANWRQVDGFALARPAPATIALDPGPPPRFGTPTETLYREAAVEIIRRASYLDPSEGALMDISPGARLNHPLGTQQGVGHAINPATAKPYAANVVNRADFGRVLAEYWADGPASETPPGHWNVIFNQVSDHPQLVRRLAGTGPVLSSLEWDVRGYLALNGAVHDAAIAAWTIKRTYDSVRPISMIRYLAGLGQSSNPAGPAYHPGGLPLEPGFIEVITAESSAPGQRHAHLAASVGKLALRSWRGSPQDPATQVGGVGWILGSRWIPYQRSTFVTPAFAGYVSGHSTFSRAAAEVLTLMTGSAFFPGGLLESTFAANRFLGFERGPSADVTFQWATYYDAADDAGWSRLWGGIHIAADDFAGRRLGSRIGLEAFLRAQQVREGGATVASGLVNLSARARAGAGDDEVVITGLVVGGAASQSVLVRSVGPGLAAYGVAGAAADPRLEIQAAGAGAVLSANDDWGRGPRVAEVAARAAQSGAFALAAGSKDAADVLSLSPGAYTVVTRAASPTTSGVVLAEVYGRGLINLSTRARVQRGEGAVIAGFTIEGPETSLMLIRAAGPSLAAFGVAGVLADPRLQVYRHRPDGGTELVATNDDWTSDARASVTLGATARAGAFPWTAGSRDAAMVLQLPAGSYSAVATGPAGEEGVVLVEVYSVR